MHELAFGGFIIDTPGIKGFGVVDFEPHEIVKGDILVFASVGAGMNINAMTYRL